MSFPHPIQAERIFLKTAVILAIASCSVYFSRRQPADFQTRERRLISQNESTHKIPRNVLFTHKTNLLNNNELRGQFNNVMKTVKAYRDAWDENAKVFFLDDENCLTGVKEVMPELAPYFEAEKRGPSKADICRLVSLHHHGGYFFDTDIEVVEAFIPPEQASFVGVLSCAGSCFSSRFIAAAPQHPIITKALQKLLDMYKRGDKPQDEDRLMAFALMEAYNELSKEELNDTHLLTRMKLDHQIHPYHHVHENFPELERQAGQGRCNVVIYSPSVEKVYFFEDFVGSDGCRSGLIPQQMWFSYKTNVLKNKKPEPIYNNIINTITKYRQAWGNENAPVRFLDDDACREMIDEAIPSLTKYFESETVGAYKGDICRNAALYLHGGYYFDVDMEVVNVVKPKDETTFVSTWACGGACFFQAFFATTPEHPILKESLRKMYVIYKKKKDNTMIGPITMANAYHMLPPEDREKDTEFFEELRLDDEMEFYPDVPRQQGDGNCNYIVHDPDQKRIYFFARFVGYGGCQPTSNEISKPAKLRKF